MVRVCVKLHLKPVLGLGVFADGLVSFLSLFVKLLLKPPTLDLGVGVPGGCLFVKLLLKPFLDLGVGFAFVSLLVKLLLLCSYSGRITEIF